MTPEDIEGIADLLLRLGRADDSSPTKAVALARALLGPGSVCSVHARALPGDGCFSVVNGAPRIYVRQGLSIVRRKWAVCHELAEWWLWKEGVREEAVEGYANGVAAALLAPRRAFQVALRECGDSYHKLAQWFGSTESCAVLRWGEVTQEPTVLITPMTIRTRGDDWGWPSEPQIRELSTGRRLTGIRKARLTDDARRVALTRQVGRSC